MKKIIIYTKDNCPFCDMAKNLMNNKNLQYKEVNVSNDQVKIDEMIKKAAGRRSVPQIFIDGDLIGGFDDLSEYNRAGKLY